MRRRAGLGWRLGMLLIGADEAGYGPLLGPLAVCACAFRIPDYIGGSPGIGAASEGGLPDLWEMLAPFVRRAPPQPPALTVDDSKRIFIRSKADPMKELLRTVGAFLAAKAVLPRVVAPSEVESVKALRDEPASPVSERGIPERLVETDDQGGRPAGDPTPASARGFLEALLCPVSFRAWSSEKFAALAESDAGAEDDGICGVDEFATLGLELAGAMAASGISFLGFSCDWRTPRQFNADLNTGLNKADINWQCLAIAVRRLADMAGPGERIAVRFDRLGGRRFYASRLADVLHPSAGRLTATIRETARESRYLLGDSADIAFLVGADRLCFPVALASMAAKLLRELAMRSLNRFFQSHISGLRPTAGYPADAARFLRETESLRRRFGIEDDSFIRRV